MKKIKTGDEVVVISGKDNGKQGKVLSLLPNGKCYVTGVKIVKRHSFLSKTQNICKNSKTSFVFMENTKISKIVKSHSF